MKIIVVTATRNCAATVADCLASVAGQSHGDREHVVVDGASTDSTLALLHERQSQLSRLVSEPDDGIYDALNKGIALATSDIVGFLHADDAFGSPLALAQVAGAFAEPSVSALYGDLQYVRKDGLSNEPPQVSWRLVGLRQADTACPPS